MKNKASTGRRNSPESIKKMSEAKKGKKFSAEHRKALSVARNKYYGNHGYSEEAKQKQRLLGRAQRIREIEERYGQIMPSYNPAACKVIEEYGATHGYDFLHAENGGEVQILGYFVDGYDENKNVVIEYYEKRHNKTKNRDGRRQQEITNHLGCEFIIIWDETE